MSPAPSKLLQLPWNAKKGVLDNLNILDIICLSLASPDMYTVAKSANRRLHHIQWIFDDNDYQIGTRITLAAKKETEEYIIKFPCPEEMENNRTECCQGKGYLDAFSKFSLQGTVFFLSVNQKNNQLVIDYGQPVKELQMMAMKLFSEHLWELFRFGEHQLLFYSNEKLNDCFVFNITKQFAMLEIENSEDGRTMTSGEIQFALETLKYEEIDFRPHARKRSYVRPLVSKHITTEDGRWLGVESIIKSESVSICLYKNSLKDDELNMIVRAWMEGGLPNLQCLTMNFEGRPMNSRKKIFREVSTVPADETNRPPYYHEMRLEDWLKNEDAVDITSKDGLSATITLGPVHGRPGFGIFVWQDKYNLKDD